MSALKVRTGQSTSIDVSVDLAENRSCRCSYVAGIDENVTDAVSASKYVVEIASIVGN